MPPRLISQERYQRPSCIIADKIGCGWPDCQYTTAYPPIEAFHILHVSAINHTFSHSGQRLCHMDATIHRLRFQK